MAGRRLVRRGRVRPEAASVPGWHIPTESNNESPRRYPYIFGFQSGFPVAALDSIRLRWITELRPSTQFDYVVPLWRFYNTPLLQYGAFHGRVVISIINIKATLLGRIDSPCCCKSHLLLLLRFLRQFATSSFDLMTRSDMPTFAGFFCLFGTLSVVTSFYWLYAVESLQSFSIIPGSTMPISWQWASVGIGGLTNLLCALALLRRLRWAKACLIAHFLWGAASLWFLSNDSLSLYIFKMAMAAVPLLVVLCIPMTPASRQRPIPPSQRVSRIFGAGVYGFAVTMMYVTVSAEFTGSSPTATSTAMTSQGAIGYLIVALLVMWFGGVLWGDKHIARRVAGILMTSLATFLLFTMTTGYVYARIHYPQVQGLYHWDATLQSLVILAMTGFALVGFSRKT